MLSINTIFCAATDFQDLLFYPNMSKLEGVLIIISNKKTGETYDLAKSYPHSDFDDDGIRETYSTPVFKVFIRNIKDDNKTQKEWSAIRFMPYWNPQGAYTDYKTEGWINSGLSSRRKMKLVTLYKKNYEIHNTYSAFNGAIQITGNFLIHAGPKNLNDSGWGSAGCIEIIGDFNKFKQDIMLLSGSKKKDPDDAILELVKAKKLFINIEPAQSPRFEKQREKQLRRANNGRVKIQ